MRIQPSFSLMQRLSQGRSAANWNLVARFANYDVKTAEKVGGRRKVWPTFRPALVPESVTPVTKPVAASRMPPHRRLSFDKRPKP